MNERDARRVLLLRAWEDPPRPPWSADDAERLTERTRQALGTGATPDDWHRHRAELGLAALAGKAPWLAAVWPRLLAQPRAPRGTLPLLLAVALGAGLAADAIGRDHALDLLSPPLLALLLWQALVLLMLAVLALRRGGAGGPHAAPDRADRTDRSDRAHRPGLPSALAGRALAAWWSRRARLTAEGQAPSADEARRLAGALPAFAAAWVRTARPWWTARLSAALHLGAIAFAVGLLGSMYARGLTAEYQARWSSTFLDTPAVTQWLRTLHAPAAALLGWPLPDRAVVARLRRDAEGRPVPVAGVTDADAAPDPAAEARYGQGSAAPWLHLQALTVLLGVVLPRALLAAWAARRARRCERDWPLPWHEPYFGRMARAATGHAVVVRVLPYSYTLGASAAPALRTQLRPSLGDALTVDVLPSLPLGVEDQLASTLAALREPPAAEQVVALFSASATPERETHGRFLRALADGLAPGVTLQALVDLAPLRQRLGTAAGTRLDERRQAWTALGEELQVPMQVIDLGRGAA